MGSIWAEMGLDTTKLDMGCAKASASLKALEGKNSALGQSAKMAATGIALIGAAVAVAAVKLAMDFETSLYNVAAITNASKAQMEGWSTSILDMSTKLPVSAKALGDAFYWVKSYMPKASDAEGFAILDTAAKLAVGGISDTTTAVKALAGTMNAYKGSSVALKDSSEYADVMATAVANGALTMQDLGDNTAKASSTAAIAGVSYRELMAAVVTLTQKGVPPATTFMALNQAMMAFIKPSDGAKAAAKDLGINFDLGNAAVFAEDPLALLDRVIGRVVSIHASDSSVRGQLKHALVGTGITPYAAFFERLAAAGWDGWICIEEASYKGREGAADAIRFVRQTWQEAQAVRLA